MPDSVPYFNDFIKATKDLFKKDKYNLGRVFEFKNSIKDVDFKGKVTVHPDHAHGKATAIVKPAWGKVELTEDLRKGISLELNAPNVYRNISVKSKHTPNDVEATASYSPPGSFWNAKVKGYYNPNKGGNRVCETTASVAVGDDALNLCVGGEATIEDTAPSESTDFTLNSSLKTYQLGFLYTPTTNSSYSLIYTPDKSSDGLRYSVTTLQKYGAFKVAARAEGIVDTKMTGTPPTIGFAGEFEFNNKKKLGLMFDTNKEWGINYKLTPVDGIDVTFGLATFSQNTVFGYKVDIN